MTDQTLKQACVMGWPVEHSLSPKIQSYWLSRYDIAGSYTAMPSRARAARRGA